MHELLADAAVTQAGGSQMTSLKRELKSCLPYKQLISPKLLSLVPQPLISSACLCHLGYADAAAEQSQVNTQAGRETEPNEEYGLHGPQLLPRALLVSSVISTAAKQCLKKKL